ncbi:hypothetical protein [Vibrio barjaei]|uniref:hypothetical protein n=1 Tax=Vibrio barjaei TaxID=1676683 RepID=UPI002283D3FC|nr:hypothetical protein [Vibrio barjaei]MCY9870365.1 hypothetical protein [Vibrio barjaei]
MNTRSESIQYLKDNKPSPEIIERFQRTIEDWNIKLPLYCAETDSITGVTELMYTLAIVHDMPDDPFAGYSERYCFENPDIALQELVNWHKRQFNDMRPAGWIAIRKFSSARALRQSFEHHYSANYGQELLKYASSGSGKFQSAIITNLRSAMAEFDYTENQVKHFAAYLQYTNQIF